MQKNGLFARAKGLLSNPNLDLIWTYGAFDDNNVPTSDAGGLVWSRNPVYCAASVYVHCREYTIYTGGWRGLTDKERESLEEHLKAMGLMPWRAEPK